MMDAKKKVLIVEDDARFLGLMKSVLASLYAVRGAVTGEDGLKLLWTFKPDLLVLDVHLPGFKGLEMIKLIREDSRVERLRILVVSADRTEQIFQRAFENGADDFLSKPFPASELRHRVANCFAHVRDSAANLIERGGITIDLESRRVSAENREIRLSPTEFALLKLLLEKEGRVVSREILIGALPQAANDGSSRSLDTHIAHLRRKLGELGASIETIPDVGYGLKS